MPVQGSTGIQSDIVVKALKECQEMDEDEYVTGLLFNGPGMQTYYNRSYCFLELAVKERVTSLCQQVKERQALILDGSGVSSKTCEKRVNEVINSDKKSANLIRSYRGNVFGPADVVGILEYDKITSARSLILRATINKLDWPYYKFVMEFRDNNGNVLVDQSESPFRQKENIRVFIIRLDSLRGNLANHSMDEIEQIVIRAVLVENVETTHVMKYVKFNELDRVELKSSNYTAIPMLGTIEHAQWMSLLDNYWEGATVFLDHLNKLVNKDIRKKIPE
jgi:hypothetical protein